MSKRRIEYLPLAEIKRAPRNPKAHDQEGIGSSLGRFGLGDLPLIDSRTGLLASGHGRISTLQRMREQDPRTPPEGVTLADNGDWLVPVVTGWSSADDGEADAYLVTQHLSERGGWYDGALADLLTSLDGRLDGLGYTQHDLDEMLLELLPVIPAADAPGAPAPPAHTPGAAAHADTAPPPAPRAAPPPTPPRPAQLWAPMSFSTTTEQRDTIQSALDAARHGGDGDNPAQALASICQFYLDYANEGQPWA